MYGFIQFINVLYFVTLVASAVSTSVTFVAVLSWLCAGLVVIATLSLANSGSILVAKVREDDDDSGEL